jgi:hypothetical protein
MPTFLKNLMEVGIVPISIFLKMENRHKTPRHQERQNKILGFASLTNLLFVVLGVPWCLGALVVR